MSQRFKLLIVRCTAVLLFTITTAHAQGLSTRDPNSSKSNRSQLRSLAPESFVIGIKNPEDMFHLASTRWVLVTTWFEPGRLSFVNIDSPARGTAINWSAKAESGRISGTQFSPHGLTARLRPDGRFDVLVLDHGGKEEAVDKLLVDVSGETPSVVDGQRILLPQGTSGNAVAFMPDDGFVVTSMFDPKDSSTATKIAEGRPTGGVWRWQPSNGWSRIGPQLSGANGIVVTKDGTHLLVNEWSARRIVRLSINGDTEATRSVDFLPDNLRETEDGRILIAGQDATAGCLFSPKANEPCSRGYVVGVVDPVSLTVETLIAKDDRHAADDGFGSATSALAIGNDLWVGSFTGDKIAIFEK